MSNITVVGSYVVDLMCRTPHMPSSGETVLGGPFKMGPGGKGGNQAVAAARLGANVSMVTKVGKDDLGEKAIQNFQNENIDTQFVTIDEKESTGAALIAVDDQGENMIVVALGACGKLSKNDVLQAESKIMNADIVLVQLETSIEAVLTSVKKSKEHNKPIILNPAPYQNVPSAIIENVTYITPNETEASLLSGVKVVDTSSALKAAKVIYNMGVKIVLITMGKAGCYLYTGDDDGKLIPGYEVEAIDTTGAGDAFNGGLAYALSTGRELKEAITYANAVAALSVTKVGTSPAMPSKEEVNLFLEQREM